MIPNCAKKHIASALVVQFEVIDDLQCANIISLS